MRQLIVAPLARVATVAILHATEAKYDAATADRYRALIQQAYVDLLADPRRPGVKSDRDIPADLRLYAIRHSRRRLAAGRGPRFARHVVAFRFSETAVEIIDLLHDSMDLPARLR